MRPPLGGVRQRESDGGQVLMRDVPVDAVAPCIGLYGDRGAGDDPGPGGLTAGLLAHLVPTRLHAGMVRAARRSRSRLRRQAPATRRPVGQPQLPMTVQCVSAEADGPMRGMRLSRRLSRTQARSAASWVSFAVQRLTPPAITAPTSTPARPTIRRYWNWQHRHRNRPTISCSPWSLASRPGNPLRAAGLRFASSAMVKL